MTRPLPTLLSQPLVAFTIEFDNEFEHRMPHTTARGPNARSGRGPWLVSRAMWTNFMRFVDDTPRPLRGLTAQVAATNLGGLRRWGYVTVDDDKHVRATPAGMRSREIWAPLPAEVEARWADRYGDATLTRLRDTLRALVTAIGTDLPHALPVVGVTKPPNPKPIGDGPGTDLPSLLSQALLAFALDAERDAPVSMVVGANVLRALAAAPDGTLALRDLSLASGLSAEAVVLSANLLAKHDCAVVATVERAKTVCLTDRGRAADRRFTERIDAVEEDWATRYGGLDELRGALAALDAQGLAEAITPRHDDLWRAHPPYAHLTRAMVADPLAALPHYPMVAHRGGYPDGS